MRIRKWTVSLFVLVCAVILPFSSAFAALEKVGTYGLTINTGQETGKLTYYRTSYIHSDGGSFKVCNKNMGTTKFFVYEYDPNGGYGNDDYVYSWTLSMGKCYTFTNLDKFKDGDNNKAELYVKAALPSGGLAFERQVILYD
ncbi:hypothetical protein [Shimazuella alba]|uniref:Uncharacterized protein n=1 Tax=Shimazuella alba TaxID=2690964 RepID=A0A6I4VXV6_9BACL|nr:hypothetical protein [Shimazuella alba]MXQ54730.1 hypothetical protein [Shimazuella alba]